MASAFSSTLEGEIAFLVKGVSIEQWSDYSILEDRGHVTSFITGDWGQ